jgi:hypothetical protein
MEPIEHIENISKSRWKLVSDNAGAAVLALTILRNAPCAKTRKEPASNVISSHAMLHFM